MTKVKNGERDLDFEKRNKKVEFFSSDINGAGRKPNKFDGGIEEEQIRVL